MMQNIDALIAAGNMVDALKEEIYGDNCGELTEAQAKTLAASPIRWVLESAEALVEALAEYFGETGNSDPDLEPSHKMGGPA